MGFDDVSHTFLHLGLGFMPAAENPSSNNIKPCFKLVDQGKGAIQRAFEPSLTLALCGEAYGEVPKGTTTDHQLQRASNEPTGTGLLYRQDSVTSSFSNINNNAVIKRERELGSEEAEIERGDEDDDSSNARKKLRLNKDQSAVLEESFKQHSTLNPKQKQELARKLNLRPRQVEVWFQNRRARTKLKQTEVDCELLKKCCETLTDENRRLQKELQELKALKLAQPFYMQLPAATLTMCPSCERIGGAGAGGDNTSKSPFTMAPKPHFFNPFTNPSAAC